MKVFLSCLVKNGKMLKSVLGALDKRIKIEILYLKMVKRDELKFLKVKIL